MPLARSGYDLTVSSPHRTGRSALLACGELAICKPRRFGMEHVLIVAATAHQIRIVA
jgi:hypothetical protein